MMHDTNILTPGRGFGKLTGHAAVMALMRRAMLVTTKQPPETVERALEGVSRESLDFSAQQQALHDGVPVQQARLFMWTPGRGKERGKYIRFFNDLARSALDVEGLDMRNATRADLYRMAQSLVQTIDEHDDGRAEWYPDGWRGWYDLVSRGTE
jgi:hypothetical protein